MPFKPARGGHGSGNLRIAAKRLWECRYGVVEGRAASALSSVAVMDVNESPRLSSGSRSRFRMILGVVLFFETISKLAYTVTLAPYHSNG